MGEKKEYEEKLVTSSLHISPPSLESQRLGIKLHSFVSVQTMK